ncbi:MAG: class I SAM-dependent methyltransferase [Candidatus Bathyarchaeia archaeon]|jgi:ubiquinone/menaquinone biosynthesis C-methylase UbiE
MVRRKIESLKAILVATSLKAILVATFEEAVFLCTKARRAGVRRAGVRKADSLRSFSAVAVDYDSKYEQYTKDTHPIVLAELEKMSFSSVLDVSCGTGTILSRISANVKKTGLDISPKMIYMAKQKLGDSADLVVGDSEMLPYANGSFDMVTCILAFHHFERPEIVVKEMHRVLKKGGSVILCDIYEPIFWRRLRANIFLRAFSDSGDLRFYSEREIKWLLNRVGFRSTVWKKAGKRFTATGVRNWA